MKRKVTQDETRVKKKLLYFINYGNTTQFFDASNYNTSTRQRSTKFNKAEGYFTTFGVTEARQICAAPHF